MLSTGLRRGVLLCSARKKNSKISLFLEKTSGLALPKQRQTVYFVFSTQGPFKLIKKSPAPRERPIIV